MLDEKQRDYNERFNEMKNSLEEALLEKDGSRRSDHRKRY